MYKKKDRFYDSEILKPISRFVAKGIAEYAFSKSDAIQFLYEHPFPCKITDAEEFQKSEWGFLKGNFIRQFTGESYNMEGTVIEFRIDDKMIEFFAGKGDCLPVLRGEIYLQNATLLKNGEFVISECSHEGILDINPKIKKDFEEEFIRLTKQDKQFGVARKLYSGLSSEQIKKFNRNTRVLYQLKSYIDEDRKEWAYSSPPEPCSFERFKGLVKDYLSSENYNYFKSFEQFKDIDYSEVPAKFFQEIFDLILIKSGKIK